MPEETLNYSNYLSIESKCRQRSGIRLLRKYAEMPDMINFGGGWPHPSLWPIDGMLVSIPTADRSVFVKGFKTRKAQDMFPIDPSQIDEGLHPDLSTDLQYASIFGQQYFVSWLRTHVDRIHGPPYSDYSVVPTAGNTDGVDAILRACVDRGSSILVEEYAYPGLLSHCASLGIDAIGVAMDEDGIVPQQLAEILVNWKGTLPKMLIVVPTCSNPSGATLPTDRKRAIYRLCHEHGIIIVEDDPYYHLSPGTGQTSLKSFLSLDTDARVIRLDSFSKIFAPGLRCGFITGPSELVQHIVLSRENSTQIPSGLSVASICAILQGIGGHSGFERQYLPKLNETYARRSNEMKKAFADFVPPQAAVPQKSSGGMFLWVRLCLENHPSYRNSVESGSTLAKKLFEALIAAKVLCIPSDYFRASPSAGSESRLSGRHFLRLSFAAASDHDIIEGVKRIGDVLRVEWGLL